MPSFYQTKKQTKSPRIHPPKLRDSDAADSSLAPEGRGMG
jgi:hypothetical protein